MGCEDVYSVRVLHEAYVVDILMSTGEGKVW